MRVVVAAVFCLMAGSVSGGDVEPVRLPDGSTLTAIDFDQTEARVETLLEVAADFRLNEDEAMQILRQVGEATGSWRRVAGRLKS